MSEDAIKQVIELVTTYGMNVLGGVIILILGWIAAKWAARITTKLMTRSGNADKTLQGFLSSLVKYAVLAFVLIAVFGAAGLAIGLALQGTLSNIAAGTVLLIFRPIKVGQVVEIAGKTGKVVSVSLFTTELATPDNIQIIIPNAAVWGSTVVNLSHHPTRRVDFVLGIGYDDDIDKAMEVVGSITEADERIHKDPAPQIVVGNLGDNSVDLTIRVWADAGNYWPIKFDLTKAFKEACDENGLNIPYPQRDVHIHQAG